MTGPADTLPRLPPAFRLVALDSVGSTQDEARRLAEADPPAEDGTLVWAREQIAGRGRQGRTWTSLRGNLYTTLILRPDCPLAEAAQLSFVAAVALADAVAGLVAPMTPLHLKWPNDLLLDGAKTAGLLLESRLAPDGTLDYLLLGAGVNIASFPSDTPYPATCLARHCEEPVSVETMLERYTHHLLAWVQRWLDDGFAPVRRAWLSHARGVGQEVVIRPGGGSAGSGTGGEEIAGTFVDLDLSGALVLDTPAGRRLIAAGDVFFRPHSPDRT